jgi:hypothetical protein
MLLCYVFAKASAGNNPEVTRLASTFLSNQGGRLPTREPVCATIEAINGRPADYQFFLRFRYATLNHVAMTVLQGRKHFKGHLSNTLTMLEYPLYSEEDDAIFRASALAHSDTAGIILLRSKLGPDGIKDKNAVLNCCNARTMTCVDVLGPYDFVVEFPAANAGDVNAMLRRIDDRLGNNILKAVPLFCRVFHPGLVPIQAPRVLPAPDVLQAPGAGPRVRCGSHSLKILETASAMTVAVALVINLFRRRRD